MLTSLSLGNMYLNLEFEFAFKFGRLVWDDDAHKGVIALDYKPRNIYDNYGNDMSAKTIYEINPDALMKGEGIYLVEDWFK